MCNICRRTVQAVGECLVGELSSRWSVPHWRPLRTAAIEKHLLYRSIGKLEMLETRHNSGLMIREGHAVSKANWCNIVNRSVPWARLDSHFRYTLHSTARYINTQQLLVNSLSQLSDNGPLRRQWITLYNVQFKTRFDIKIHQSCCSQGVQKLPE